jgi:hypothetical protein
VNGWTRVDDGLPEEGRVLWLSDGKSVDAGEYFAGFYWWRGLSLDATQHVYTSHWRYADVPEPPKD